MKQLFTVLLAVITLASCQKESLQYEDNNTQKETAIPLILIESITPICNSHPFLYPSPGVSILFNAYTNSMVLSAPGNIVVWMRPLGSGTWSSKTVTTPCSNPVKVSYASCTPSLGTIPAGTVMELKVSQPGGINSTPVFTFIAISCIIGPR